MGKWFDVNVRASRWFSFVLLNWFDWMELRNRANRKIGFLTETLGARPSQCYAMMIRLFLWFFSFRFGMANWIKRIYVKHKNRLAPNDWREKGTRLINGQRFNDAQKLFTRVHIIVLFYAMFFLTIIYRNTIFVIIIVNAINKRKLWKCRSIWSVWNR